MGIGKVEQYLSRYGFGQPSGIDLSGENTGILPNPAWKMKNRKERWYPGDTVNIAIGQGDWKVTPLQLVRGTGALADDGRLREPHLVDARRERFDAPWAPLPQPSPRPISENPGNLQVVREGMVMTVHGPGGTARPIGVGIPYHIAGKTGTAQVVSRRGTAAVNPRSLPMHLRHRALFVGYAPAEDPQIAVAIAWKAVATAAAPPRRSPGRFSTPGCWASCRPVSRRSTHRRRPRRPRASPVTRPAPAWPPPYRRMPPLPRHRHPWRPQRLRQCVRRHWRRTAIPAPTASAAGAAATLQRRWTPPRRRTRPARHRPHRSGRRRPRLRTGAAMRDFLRWLRDMAGRVTRTPGRAVAGGAGGADGVRPGGAVQRRWCQCRAGAGQGAGCPFRDRPAGDVGALARVGDPPARLIADRVRAVHAAAGGGAGVRYRQARAALAQPGAVLPAAVGAAEDHPADDGRLVPAPAPVAAAHRHGAGGRRADRHPDRAHPQAAGLRHGDADRRQRRVRPAAGRAAVVVGGRGGRRRGLDRAGGVDLAAASLPEGPHPHLPRSGARPARHRLEHHPVQDRDRLRRAHRQGLGRGQPVAPELHPRTDHRFHLRRAQRGAGLAGRGHGAGAVPVRGRPLPVDRDAGARHLLAPARRFAGPWRSSSTCWSTAAWSPACCRWWACRCRCSATAARRRSRCSQAWP